MLGLRPEAPADHSAVRQVLERAFPTPAEADLVEELRAAGAHVPELCMVAVEGGAVVGHIAYSRAQLESGPEVLALAPMAVLPDRQRRGIGSALVTEALGRAAQTEYPLVVVVGHPEYYPRFGFEPAGALGIECPFPVPPEAWMAFRLPAYGPAVRGIVVYADAFG